MSPLTQGLRYRAACVGDDENRHKSAVRSFISDQGNAICLATKANYHSFICIRLYFLNYMKIVF